MTATRLPKASYILASLYLAWSSFAYFGSLGGSGHSWWPMFLYGPIWPCSWGIESLLDLLHDGLIPNPETVPESVYLTLDRVAGGTYILVGTAWYWWIGKLVSLAATKWFGQKNPPPA